MPCTIRFTTLGNMLLFHLIGLTTLAGMSLGSLKNSERPHVVILTTGGTIASVSDAPIVEGSRLIGALPQLAELARIEVIEFSKIGSSQMTPQHWLRMLHLLHEIDRQSQPASIVITHGTDTMEETAFFLNLTYKGRATVVMVGSMRTSDEVSADGPANLINAVRVGIDSSSTGKGILVVMNENIASGRDVRKMHNRRVDTFRAGDMGFLGSVDPDAITYYRQPARPHTGQTEFHLSDTTKLPRVEIVHDFTDFDPEILHFFTRRDIDGLVVTSFAGGRVSAGMRSALTNHEPNSPPLVVASGVDHGRIVRVNPADSEHVIWSRHFPPRHARILLMLALTQTDDHEAIQLMFNQY